MDTHPTPPTAIEALLWDLPLRGLHVDVNRDLITLHGSAPCYRTKHEAVERIRKAMPDTCIANELRVAQTDADDKALARDVAAAVRAVAPGVDVRVAVRDGIATIYAPVRDDGMRRAMIAAAWQAAAGHHVRGEFHLSRGDDAAVEAALNAYVQRSMGRTDPHVRVTYAKGVATLTGSVSSPARACAVEDLLRWHDGVGDVVNRLRVAPPRTTRTTAGKAL